MPSTIATYAKRQFLRWQELPLPAAAKWLASQHVIDDELNMSESVLVVPGSRAQRRLLELLLDYTEHHQLVFTPPEITTIGTFPELLYRPQRPLASQLVQMLAWVEALKGTSPEELSEFTGNIPDPDDSVGWHSLGNVLSRWHNELAGNGMTFRDVLEAGKGVTHFREAARWKLIHKIQRRYLDILNREKMWDRQTARLVAIDHNECQIDKCVYLVGTVDLNPTSRKMLQQIASQVTAVVFADEQDHDKFDDLGCLDIEAWESSVLNIDDADICVADQPADQAKIVTRFLFELGGQYGVDQISVGIPDPRLIPVVSRSLAEAGVKSCDIGGTSIGNTRPFVLLELLAAWLEDHRFESFAALVRHPDMYQWIVARTQNHKWLMELDEYQNNRLPFYISTDINEVYFEGKDRHGLDRYAVLKMAYQEIYGLIQPLLSPRGKGLDAWAASWKKVMVGIYRDTVLNRNDAEHRRTIRACQEIVKSLIEIEESGSLLEGVVSSVETITWALNLCGDSFVADPSVEDSLSLVGWLDTAWEDTPVTVITCVNEGLIPSSEESSLFLPNSIRTKMGLVDNRRRYARDAYALSLVLHSRDRVLLVAGRRDEDGLPMLPSRLLMTGESSLVARRAIRLFNDGMVTADWSIGRSESRPREQQFVIPGPPDDLEPINSMRVTDFKVYLSCPYRYYLTRVLNLNRLADNKDELDGGQFGSLIHDVVENYGRSDQRNSDRAEEIESFLIDCLNRFSMARYGLKPVPTVQIQLEQARLRLRAFANWQARHRKEGFEIFEVEREKTRHEFDLDGSPFEIRGQIDRIDVNHKLKKVGVYDYKTGDRGDGPRELHQTRNGNWKDLQLPLYHHLLGNFDLPPDYEVETGLIVIAKNTSQVSLLRADWSASELAIADTRAFETMRRVRDGMFWPPTEKNLPPYWDDFAGICQSGVFEKWSPAGPGDRP